MKIEILDKGRYTDYEQFLLSHEHSLFYHSTRYKDFLEDLLRCESQYLLALDKGKIVGALPLMIKDGPLGKVVNSLPYYGSNGGCVSSSAYVQELLLNAYKKFIFEQNIISATMVDNPIDLLKITPVHNMRDQRIGQLTSIKGYVNHEESIFKIIDGNRRNEIRRAQKHNVTVFEDNSQIDFIRLVHQSEMKKNNRKFKSNEFFYKIGKHFKPGENFKIFIAYRNNRPVAGLLMFYFNKTAEYFTPVVLEEERIFQPMSLILFYALLDAMKRNYQWFNWGGTWLTQEGVYRFKKQMGAIDCPYQYYTYINKPEILAKSSNELVEIYPEFYLYNFNNPEILQ